MCSEIQSHETDEITRIVTDGPCATGEQLGVAVPRAVADATDNDILELPPLQQYVDVDALEALFSTGRSEKSVSFTYGDVHVTVRSEGVIDVRR